MKIVCAMDFTPRGQAAAQIAVDLARRTGGWVELVHVMKPGTVDILALAADAVVLEAEVRAEVEARLAGECDRLSTGGVPVTFRVCEGDVETSVLDRAREIEAELIVTGTHGRSALRRFLVGSVGEELARGSDRPILVVPPGVEGLGSENGASRTLSITVALDGRATNAGALSFVRQLRAHVPCDVTFLRLYWAIEEFQRLGLTGPRDLFEPDADVVADLERALRLEVGVLPGTGQTSFAIKPAWGEPSAQILEFARGPFRRPADRGGREPPRRRSHQPPGRRRADRARGLAGPGGLRSPGRAAGRWRRRRRRSSPSSPPPTFPPAGNRAVSYAYALLAAHGGVVELCHVHERVLAAPAYAYERTEGKLTDAERTQMEDALRALIPADAKQRGITTHVTVIDGGRAGDAIVQASERLVVDAVVLASHGKGGALKSLLGSVSHVVVENSRRPVLIIPSARP